MKILIMGLPGSGKTALAEKLQEKLKCVWFNGDEIRDHINKDLRFTASDRYEQARRMGRLCDIVLRSNPYVIADFICPTDKTRNLFNPDFIIWLNTVTKSVYPDTNRVFVNPAVYNIRIDNWDYDINDIRKSIIKYGG